MLYFISDQIIDGLTDFSEKDHLYYLNYVGSNDKNDRKEVTTIPDKVVTKQITPSATIKSNLDRTRKSKDCSG
ncbi:MAG: hypothetical protein HRU35_05855 [Rickettsiaceae bacterium]|nr:hypothetical protein [Rickettsiaceae bacterium]